MKIEITLHNETTTEDGRTVPAGIYSGEYNPASGEVSSAQRARDDMDAYDAIRLNQRLIGRAIDDADENDNAVQTVLEGSGEFRGRTCRVKMFTSRGQ